MLREPVIISMLPAFPSAPRSTTLKIPLASPLLPTPSNKIKSEAIISTPPAFPIPKVVADISAPLVRESESVIIEILPPSPSALFSTTALMTPPLVIDREPVVILSEPPFPSASVSTALKIPLASPLLPTPSREIKSVAVMVKLPALPCTPEFSTDNPPLLALI